MAYLTKDPHGVIFLWDNKPSWREQADTYFAWLPGCEGEHYEIPIYVGDNDYFRSVFENKETPAMIEFSIHQLLSNDEIGKIVHDALDHIIYELAMNSEDGKYSIKDINEAFYAGTDCVLKAFDIIDVNHEYKRNE